MLGIHGSGFVGTDVEEGIVEFIDDVVLQHVSTVNVGQTFQGPAIVVVITIDIEACDAPLGVLAREKIFPKLRR